MDFQKRGQNPDNRTGSSIDREAEEVKIEMMSYVRAGNLGAIKSPSDSLFQNKGVNYD